MVCSSEGFPKVFAQNSSCCFFQKSDWKWAVNAERWGLFGRLKIVWVSVWMKGRRTENGRGPCYRKRSGKVFELSSWGVGYHVNKHHICGGKTLNKDASKESSGTNSLKEWNMRRRLRKINKSVLLITREVKNIWAGIFISILITKLSTHLVKVKICIETVFTCQMCPR